MQHSRDTITVHFKCAAKKNLKTQGLLQTCVQGAKNCYDYLQEELEDNSSGTPVSSKDTESVYTKKLGFTKGMNLTLTAEERMILCEALTKVAVHEVDIIPLMKSVDRITRG